jgi:hypothetical protein
MENAKSTNKRPASGIVAPPLPPSQDKKPKPNSTDAALLTGSSRNRLKTLVLPARRKKTLNVDIKSLQTKEPEKKECNNTVLLIYALRYN